MRQVTRELRGAYARVLSNVEYNDTVIPVNDSMTNGRGSEVTLDGGATMLAYINLSNQYRGSNQLKNGLEYKVSITVDINTVFSGDSYSAAGNEWAEVIADSVNDALFNKQVFNLVEFGINLDRFIITSTNNYIQPMPLQYTDTSRVFRVIMVFEHTIQQLVNTDPQPDLYIIQG